MLTKHYDFFDTKKAACKGEDITLFYPILPAGQHRKDVEIAKHLCEQCEVIKGCLEYSLHYEPLGIWGGKSEVEREVLRQQKNNFNSAEVRSSLFYNNVQFYFTILRNGG